MRRITAGVLAAAVGGSMLLTAGPALAHRQDLKVDLTRINPNPVQVGRHGSASVTFEVVSKGAARVEVTLRPVNGRFKRQKEARLAASDAPRDADRRHGDRRHGDLSRFVARFDGRDAAGRWVATAIAFDRSGKKVSDREFFAVEVAKSKFDTHIVRFAAFPKKVRKGKPVSLRGVLLAEDRRAKGYAGQEVDILYRSHGRAPWRKLGDVRTDRFGKFNARVKAFKSGQYKAVFEGNDDAKGSESGIVGVRVKRGFHHFH